MGAPTKAKKKESLRKNPLYRVGYDDGRRDMRNAALTFLEQKYLHPSVARDSVEGKAILELASELAKHLKMES